MLKQWISLCFVSCLVILSQFSCKPRLGSDNSAVRVTDAAAHNKALAEQNYEAIRVIGLKPTKDLKEFIPKQGISVAQRDGDGRPSHVVIRVLAGYPNAEIFVIGDFNDWGERDLDRYKLEQVEQNQFGTYYEGDIPGIKHGMQYRLLVDGQQLLDPAGHLLTTPEYFDLVGLKSEQPYLNCVFWDFEGPEVRMNPMEQVVDLREKPVVIGETEVYAVAAKWTFEGKQGPSNKNKTYRFIAESGLIQELARIGYNSIEFLPFNASIDGDTWNLRYQVVGTFAPDSRYGTPSDFAAMVGAFKKEGIGVIMDAVLGHYPFQGNTGVRDVGPIGLHKWKKDKNGSDYGDNLLYGGNKSPWNTYRYDYTNPNIQRFLIDSVLFMVKYYGVSGIRFDNLDGVRFEGGGEDFLKILVEEIRSYRPEMLLVGEMFFGESRVFQSLDKGGMGFNVRTHSDLFDFFKDNLLKRTEEIDMQMLRDAIRNLWDWKEAPRLHYLTNHDEASNGRQGATGQYPASLIGGDAYHQKKKIIAFGSAALFSGSYFMDMPQMRLLQQGTFYSNPVVAWDLRGNSDTKEIYDYYAAATKYYQKNPAFAFLNYHTNIENHTDNSAGNKVISFERVNFEMGKYTYIVVNLGHNKFQGYRIGAGKNGAYTIKLDSSHLPGFCQDREEGCGTVNSDGKGEHGKAYALEIPTLNDYSVVVLELQ